MCGRYRLTRPDKLAGRFYIEPEDDWVPRYNIAPAQIPVSKPLTDFRHGIDAAVRGQQPGKCGEER
jgi:putative SOS response-associated peptidase YedK